MYAGLHNQSPLLLRAGDLNLRVDNNLDKSSQDFQALVDSFNLMQHVCFPTNRAGHRLDLLITRNDDQLVTSVSVHDAAFSDHFVLSCALSMEKPLFTKKQILYRSYKNFYIDLFMCDTRGSSEIRQMNLMTLLQHMILNYLEFLTDMFPLRSIPLPFAQRHLGTQRNLSLEREKKTA